MWEKLLYWTRYFLRHKEQTEENSNNIVEQERTVRALAHTVQ